MSSSIINTAKWCVFCAPETRNLKNSEKEVTMRMESNKLQNFGTGICEAAPGPIPSTSPRLVFRHASGKATQQLVQSFEQATALLVPASSPFAALHDFSPVIEGTIIYDSGSHPE